MAGSVGLAGAANLGPRHAVFEAVHGTAPDLAGRGAANPAGLLAAAVMMLRHVGMAAAAAAVEAAVLRAVEDGVRTADMAGGGPAVGTMEFARAVAARLGSGCVPAGRPARRRRKRAHLECGRERARERES